MAIQVGQDIGSYHIIEVLGHGGMARVYKAYDTVLEREVAIKFIRVDMIGSAQLGQVLKRFEREARSLAKFLHPNIVPVHGYGEYEGVPYLVMAYLPGGTLKALTGKPMPYDQAARLLAPVARALEYAHEEHVIHRDIKPSNILLTKKGIPMLSDFGIAKILGGEETTQLTQTGIGVGTPEYMAPEQWEGKALPQTDIYTLGVVFYELLTGRKPYEADTPAAIYRKQLTEPLPGPRSFVPDLPEEVERVLFKAMAKDAENRYVSMAEFAGVLERLGTQTLSPTPIPLEEESTLVYPGIGKMSGFDGTVTASVPPAQPAVPSQSVPPGLQAQRQVQPSSVIDHPAMPLPAAQPSRRSGVLHAAGVKSIGGYAAWVGIGMVALCLLGIMVAGIATQGFGLFKTKTQPAVTQAGTQAALQLATHALTSVFTAAPSQSPVTIKIMDSELDGMVLVYIPEGEFLMGATDSEFKQVVQQCIDGASEADCTNEMKDEEPPHLVSLDSFWIDQTEVTNAMYAKCVLAGLCQKPLRTDSSTRVSYYDDPQYGDYPVIWVDWNMASAYCTWAGRRLPTEAEWEKAARGTDGYIYPWGNQPPDSSLANFNNNVGDTTKVGKYLQGASPFGALDMVGNVWEWVNDWYDATYYDKSPYKNPTGPDSGQERVLRGGSWIDVTRNIRVSYRFKLEPVYGYNIVGFRCAR